MDSSMSKGKDLSIGEDLTEDLNLENEHSLVIHSLPSMGVQPQALTEKKIGEASIFPLKPAPGALMTTEMVQNCHLTDSDFDLGKSNRVEVQRPTPRPRRSIPKTEERENSVLLPDADLDNSSRVEAQAPTPRPRSSVPKAEERDSSIPLPASSLFAQFETESEASTAASLPPRVPPRRSLDSKSRSADVDDRMFKLRNYQEEISHNVVNQLNDIIILPTGTGKTPVAIHAIWKHLTTAGRKRVKVLFLAHRVVLAEQQLEVIKSHLPLEWANKCEKLTGGDIDSMDDLEQMLTGDEWAVIVATPQTVFNYFLAFESSTMRQFSLIIFDEVHNAVGGHPYSRLLNQYMDEKFMSKQSRVGLPQMVGLTASVGLGDARSENSAVDYILSMCAKVDLRQHPSEVIKYKEELEAIRSAPVEEHRKVEQFRSDPFSTFIKDEIMAEIISDVRAKMRTHRSLQRIRFDPKKNVTSQSFEQKCVQAENQLSFLHDNCQNDKARDCYVSIRHLRVYYLALKWANLATLRDAMDYLDEEVLKPELSGNKFADKYREVWQEHLEELASRECDYVNEKLMILKEELDKALAPQNCRNGEAPRVMIFVEYRRVASMINHWVNSLGSEYRSERFVSRLASGADFGMTREESQTVMLKFRLGEFNILVATSVLSEGIDIPECNGTIRYMYMKDVIAEVQVPGRMRSWGGRVVAIIDEKLFKLYRENKTKEILMGKALQKVRQMSQEEFLKRIELEQERGYLARLSDKKRKNAGGGNGVGKSKNAQINCKQCGRTVGQLSDVHRYLENHYIILDKYVLENVDVSEAVEYRGIPLDGMSDVGILICMEQNCNAELGRLIKIRISNQTRKLGIWDITKVRVAGSNGNFTKWEDVAKAYGIEDIKQEKLRAKIDSGFSIQVES